MLMSTVREKTRGIMVVLAVAFAAWLVLNWVQSRQSSASTGPNPVVGVVNGREIHFVEWSRFQQAQTDAARQRSSRPLSEEQLRTVTANAWKQMVDDILIQQELDKNHIEVSDAEVRQAFRFSPPPDLISHPAFQTDGKFDYKKYQDFFSNPGVDEALLLQIENYYRTGLPRTKLLRQLSEGIYVSNGDAFAAYKDRTETAVVRFLSIDPQSEVEDAQVEITGPEVRDYYRAHVADFVRPASAVVSMVTVPNQPSAADTAMARTIADSLREQIRSGKRTFEEVARESSADTATAASDGKLGRFARGQLVGPIEETAFSIRRGRVSKPVLAGRGFHLVRVPERNRDTVTVEHILVPIVLSPESDDALFSRLDRLEGIALVSSLAEAADSVGLTVRTGVTLTKGSDFVPGVGILGVAVDWAFKKGTEPGEVSDIYNTDAAYAMFELEKRTPETTLSMDEVRPQIERILRGEKKKKLAAERAQKAVKELRDGRSFAEVAKAHGWESDSAGPFNRTQFVKGLGRDTEAVGAAFGLPVGGISDALDAGTRIVILQVTARKQADPKAFESVREQIKAQLSLQRRQAAQQRWLQALRDAADVVDLRDRLNQSS